MSDVTPGSRCQIVPTKTWVGNPVEYFMIPPTSKTHQLFVGKTDSADQKGGFIDPWEALHKSENNAGTFNDFKGDKTGDRIDWILVTSQLKIRNMVIIHDSFDNRYPSDHFPVLAVLKL